MRLHGVRRPGRARWYPVLSLFVLLGLLASVQAQEEKKKPFFKKGPDPKGFQDKRSSPGASSDQVKQLQEEIDRLREKLRAATAGDRRDDKARGPEPRGPQGKFGKDERKGPPPAPGGRFGKDAKKGPPRGEGKGPPPRGKMAGRGDQGRTGPAPGKQHAPSGQRGYQGRHHSHHGHHAAHHGDGHGSQSSLSDISRRLDRLQREVAELRHSMQRRR